MPHENYAPTALSKSIYGIGSWVGLSKCVDFFEADKNLLTLPRFELPVVQ
jgi:hypothetical protein